MKENMNTEGGGKTLKRHVFWNRDLREKSWKLLETIELETIEQDGLADGQTSKSV